MHERDQLVLEQVARVDEADIRDLSLDIANRKRRNTRKPRFSVKLEAGSVEDKV